MIATDMTLLLQVHTLLALSNALFLSSVARPNARPHELNVQIVPVLARLLLFTLQAFHAFHALTVVGFSKRHRLALHISLNLLSHLIYVPKAVDDTADSVLAVLLLIKKLTFFISLLFSGLSLVLEVPERLRPEVCVALVELAGPQGLN